MDEGARTGHGRDARGEMSVFDVGRNSAKRLAFNKRFGFACHILSYLRLFFVRRRLALRL